MSAAATHVGHCQVCGNEQKLPGGKLAKHGYSVQWGFFSGVCQGSGHDPFEVSKDRIDAAIQRALVESGELEDRAIALDRPATEPVATCRVYRSQRECQNRFERPGYVWITGRIEPRPPRHGMRFVVVDDSGREFYVHTERASDSPLEAATWNNQMFAREVIARSRKLREYAAWQRERIEAWEPQPLRPLRKSGEKS